MSSASSPGNNPSAGVHSPLCEEHRRRPTTQQAKGCPSISLLPQISCEKVTQLEIPEKSVEKHDIQTGEEMRGISSKQERSELKYNETIR